jgi:hypothetical protein
MVLRDKHGLSKCGTTLSVHPPDKCPVLYIYFTAIYNSTIQANQATCFGLSFKPSSGLNLSLMMAWKIKPKRVAWLTFKVVYGGALIIYVTESTTRMCHVKVKCPESVHNLPKRGTTFSVHPSNKCRVITAIRAWSLSSKSFPVYWSLLTTRFDSLWCRMPL